MPQLREHPRQFHAVGLQRGVDGAIQSAMLRQGQLRVPFSLGDQAVHLLLDGLEGLPRDPRDVGEFVGHGGAAVLALLPEALERRRYVPGRGNASHERDVGDEQFSELSRLQHRGPSRQKGTVGRQAG